MRDPCDKVCIAVSRVLRNAAENADFSCRREQPATLIAALTPLQVASAPNKRAHAVRWRATCSPRWIYKAAPLHFTREGAHKNINNSELFL